MLFVKSLSATRGSATECAEVPDDTYTDGQNATEAIKLLKTPSPSLRNSAAN